MRNQPKSRHADHQPMNWRQYQNEVATLFRAAGCDAKVEEIVEGARGAHAIDVYVTFKQYGINSVWIVECKYWNRRVSKEKVMALSGIVADCGADKGIIISKNGFQSGAVRAASKTNIILTSLEELTNISQIKLTNLKSYIRDFRKRKRRCKNIDVQIAIQKLYFAPEMLKNLRVAIRPEAISVRDHAHLVQNFRRLMITNCGYSS
jgi:hypothetical protein